LHELLIATPAIRKMIQHKTPVEQIAHQSMTDGMLTLKQDGMLKMLMGQADLASIRQVCG
jgi:type II secretory ATPase GspE/PulE/Tfp pilus assembly ATPase PilB-like protein